MEQNTNINQISLRNYPMQNTNQMQTQITNMNEIVMQDMNLNNETSLIKKGGTELILRNKSFKFGKNEGKLNSVIIKGGFADINEVLNNVVMNMMNTGNYNSTLEMYKCLKKINQFENNVS